MDDKLFKEMLSRHLDNALARSEWMGAFLKDWTAANGRILGVIAGATNDEDFLESPSDVMSTRLRRAEADQRNDGYTRRLAQMARNEMERDPPPERFEEPF